MQLTITATNIEEVNADLAQLVRRAEDLRPVLAQFGVHMIRSVETNFAVGGRPRWLSSRRALVTGGKTLIKSAILKNSIVAQVAGAHTLSIGTAVPYASVHQLGFYGAVQVPAHLRRVKSRDVFLRPGWMSKSAGWISTGKKQRIGSGFAMVRAHSRQMRVPARPFLLVQDSDMQILKAMLEQHLVGGK